MPNTVDTGLLPRTYFKAPRVPFDFRALALAVLGYLVYWGGGILLSKIFGKPDIPGAFLGSLNSLFRDIPYIGPVIGRFFEAVFHMNPIDATTGDYSFWHKLVGGIWFFAIWSFFGQAIHRITALRIARDEGLSFKEALAFGARNWLTMLRAPVIVLGAIGFFYVCNMFAGLLISIPGVGQILALILVPLAIISTLLILLIALGGVLGIPLVGAAAAWERNGSLDAISRAFSYVFARPLQFFWNYFLIFLFIGVILLVGSWFIYTLDKSIDSGAIFSDEFSVLIDPPERITGEGSEFSELSGPAQNLYDKLSAPESTGYRPSGRDAPRITPFARDIHAVGEAPWTQKLNALIFWLAINLIWVGVKGYALYWFLGATTCVYADLRADVDGTEEDEIFLDDDEEEFDALAEATAQSEPPPPPGDAPDAPAEPASGGESDGEGDDGSDATGDDSTSSTD